MFEAQTTGCECTKSPSPEDFLAQAPGHGSLRYLSVPREAPPKITVERSISLQLPDKIVLILRVAELADVVGVAIRCVLWVHLDEHCETGSSLQEPSNQTSQGYRRDLL